MLLMFRITYEWGPSKKYDSYHANNLSKLPSQH